MIYRVSSLHIVSRVQSEPRLDGELLLCCAALAQLKDDLRNNNNAGVFILRRLHLDDNERVITTL